MRAAAKLRQPHRCCHWAPHQRLSPHPPLLYRISHTTLPTTASPPAALPSDGRAPASEPATHDVIICGAGLQGAATAYFLTQHGIRPLVLERTGVGAAASGKAGGFLAREWGDRGPTEQLHRASFDLHEELAVKLGISSYRRIPTLSVAGGKPRRGAKEPPASWLDGNVARAELMGGATAQVTPIEITTKLMDAAVAAGAELRRVTVVGIDTEEAAGGDAATRKVVGVRIRRSGDGAEAAATQTGAEGEVDLLATRRVVVAMGPWSVLAEDWLGPATGLRVPMEGIKSTSLVYGSDELRRRVTAEPCALFCSEDANGCHLEVYPRSNGEVYICGCGESDYVSGDRLRAGGDCEHQGLVHADPSRVRAAAASFSSLTTLGRTPDGSPGTPDVSQACMRPCATDALPIMGEVPGVQGAYLACGHNCWGILWGPITGKAMAELIVQGHASSLDLSPFSPERFMAGRRRGQQRGRHAGSVAVGEQW